MEPWREELYLQHGLFDSLRSKYKTVSDNVKKAAGNGREWKNHKYIRKEGTRYIYKDNLKKTSKPTKRDSEKVEVDTGNIKRTYTDKYYGHGQRTLSRYMPKLSFKRLSKPNSSTLVGEEKGNATYKYSKKLEKDIRDAHGSDNHISEMEQIYDGPNLGWNTTIFESNVYAKNGEKWFKSEIEVSATKVTTNMGSNGLTQSTVATYTISYSKTRQLYNKGKSFINKLFSNWNKYRPGVDTTGTSHTYDYQEYGKK